MQSYVPAVIGSVTTGHGSVTTGHGYPPTIADANIPFLATTQATYNGHIILAEGGTFVTHCIPPSCHIPVAASGVPTITLNGIPIAYVGLVLSCGDVVTGAIA